MNLTVNTNVVIALVQFAFALWMAVQYLRFRQTMRQVQGDLNAAMAASARVQAECARWAEKREQMTTQASADPDDLAAQLEILGRLVATQQLQVDHIMQLVNSCKAQTNMARLE